MCMFYDQWGALVTITFKRESPHLLEFHLARKGDRVILFHMSLVNVLIH